MPKRRKWLSLRFIKNEFFAFLSIIWMLIILVGSILGGLLILGLIPVILFFFYSGTAIYLPERAYDYAVAKYEKEPSRLLPPVPAGSGTEYSFLYHDTSGAVITWDPCMPIKYVINTDGMPKNGKKLIQSAFQEVSAGSGLQFVYAGDSSEPYTSPRQAYQPSTYPSLGKNWAPVLISWLSDKDFMKALEVDNARKDAVGFAGPENATTDDYSNQNELLGRTYAVSGTVTLKSSWFNSNQALSNPKDARAILMHEFGHLVGLAHVKSKSQIMYEDNSGRTKFGDGDLAGLAKLGSGKCAKPHERPHIRTINYAVKK
jgi:hypothetical protein